MNLVINFSTFHLGWLACVAGAANGLAVEGSSVALLLIGLHLYRTPLWRTELHLILAVALVGLIWETAFLSQHWVLYAGQTHTLGITPLWMLIVWGLFATTINASMAWMKGRRLVSMVMGAVFGPMAFVAGEQLGAVVFIERQLGLMALAFGWAILMPLVMWVAEWINNYNGPLVITSDA